MAKNDGPEEIAQGELVPMNGDAPGTEIMPFVDERGEVIIHGETARQLRELLATIPVDDENGNQRIAEQLLSAKTVVDLNKPWESTGGRELVGREMRVDWVKARPSQYAGGLGAFLVVEFTDTATGEKSIMTTSAMAPIIQLARLHAGGWLPAYCKVIVSERPTEKGFYPYHLQFMPPPTTMHKAQA